MSQCKYGRIWITFIISSSLIFTHHKSNLSVIICRKLYSSVHCTTKYVRHILIYILVFANLNILFQSVQYFDIKPLTMSKQQVLSAKCVYVRYLYASLLVKSRITSLQKAQTTRILCAAFEMHKYPNHILTHKYS